MYFHGTLAVLPRSRRGFDGLGDLPRLCNIDACDLIVSVPDPEGTGEITEKEIDHAAQLAAAQIMCNRELSERSVLILNGPDGQRVFEAEQDEDE